MRRQILILALASMVGTSMPVRAIETGTPAHGLSLYGTPKYGPDFSHFDYVNPDAPKGGTFIRANGPAGTFDTFNTFSPKGVGPVQTDILHDTLMTSGQDEPFTMYGLIAETAEVDEDLGGITFVLRGEAAFNDGSPITAEDVVFSFNKLTTEGLPIYRNYWAGVERVEALDDRTVRFDFKTNDNKELPLILGQLPVISKAYWEPRDFSETSLDRPVVSGPYEIGEFEVGRYIQYRRVENYWAKDLPATQGMYNFDEVRVEYFRDQDVAFEAFKAGTFTFHRNSTARVWETGYTFPAVQDGRVVRRVVESKNPMSPQGMAFNLRREKFQDRRVREALNLAFDFESLNRTVFFGLYDRVRSYFQNTELEPVGPPGDAELELLEPYRDQLPPDLFTEPFTQPSTDTEGGLRANLLKARALLDEAGWEERDGVLVNGETGEPFTIEILLLQENLDVVWLPYIQNLQRLGIQGDIRVVDSSQFITRLQSWDYDIIRTLIPGNSLTPGNEQVEFWGTEAADRPGSRNVAGVKDPVVDAMIGHLLKAETYADIVTAAKALDRVITWNHYTLMTNSSPYEYYAIWSHLKLPAVLPDGGLGSGGLLAPTLMWDARAAEVVETRDALEPGPDMDPEDNRLWLVIMGSLGVILLIWRYLSRRR